MGEHTSSVNYELVGATADRNGGDVADVFICDGARASLSDTWGGDTVDLVDPGMASVNEILDRRDAVDVLQRQNGGPGLELDRRCRDHGGGNKSYEKHGVWCMERPKTSR